MAEGNTSSVCLVAVHTFKNTFLGLPTPVQEWEKDVGRHKRLRSESWRRFGLELSLHTCKKAFE